MLQLMERFKFGSRSGSRSRFSSGSSSSSQKPSLLRDEVACTTSNDNSSSSTSSSGSSSSSSRNGSYTTINIEKKGNTVRTRNPPDPGLDSTNDRQFKKLASLLQAEKVVTGECSRPKFSSRLSFICCGHLNSNPLKHYTKR